MSYAKRYQYLAVFLENHIDYFMRIMTKSLKINRKIKIDNILNNNEIFNFLNEIVHTADYLINQDAKKNILYFLTLFYKIFNSFF
jgi:hypothetical protein